MAHFNSFRDFGTSMKKNVNPKPSPMTRGEDGVDHINIGDKAATQLGRLLSLTKQRVIQHPQLGNFMSVQSVWSYVRSVEQDDRTRSLHGKKLLNFSQRMQSRRVSNFNAIIAAIYISVIENDAEFKRLLIENTLPFDYYDVVSEEGLRVRKKFEHWFTPTIEAIAKAYKDGSDPMQVALNLRDVKSKPIFFDAIVGIELGEPVKKQDKPVAKEEPATVDAMDEEELADEIIEETV